METELASVIANVGTMLLCALIIDRAYKLALRWLELQHHVDVYGPKPLVIRGSGIIPLEKVVTDDSENTTT